MSDLLPFVFIGLATGSVYGLAGAGLVLTYRTSGIFNFAHGALATVSAYVFYSTVVLEGWPPVVAAAVSVLLLGPLMGVLLELIARRIQTATLAVQVASTVGVLLIVKASVQILYGSLTTRQVESYFPDKSIDLAGANLQYSNLITFALTTVIVVALSIFLRKTRKGVAMLAVVDDPDLLALSATNPIGTRRLAWIIGSTLAAGSGVLFAPLVPLDPTRLTLLVVAAFGATAVGMFRNLPLTFAGGLGIGVLAALCTQWFSSGVLAGLSASVPFLVLFVVLIVYPKRLLAERTHSITRSRPAWRAPARAQIGLAAVLLLVLLFVPQFAQFEIVGWMSALSTSIVILALVLLVRMSGQVSLCHVTFMAIGAVALSHLTLDQGWPWGLALLAAGLIAVPLGAILAIPAIRLGGLYLALATLGFGVLVQSMFYTQSFFFDDTGAGLTIPRPSSMESDSSFYYLVLIIATICALAVAAISYSRLGRLLRGISDSVPALETSGASVTITRVLVFCLSAFMASIGGGLAAASLGSASAESYSPLLSLQFFVLVIILVGGAPWDAIVGGFSFALIPVYFPSTEIANYLELAFGIFAVLYGLTATKEVDYSRVQAAIDRMFGVRRRGGSTLTDDERDELAQRLSVSDSVFEASGVRVTYGGVVAVDGVSVTVPTGQITGLIGPNGAGKTTFFNACSGLLNSASGDVKLGDQDLSSLGVAHRARLGLGRTFQRMQLFESLTVAENVAFGAESAMAGANPLRHIVGRRHEDRRVDISTAHALELCGLSELSAVNVAALSTGQRRLVELARCLAGDFKILLLDEPSSGLDQAETAHFGQILRRVVAERNVGVLLVEHDMSLVLGTCDKIYVIDFGKPIFEGTADEVASSPIVRSVYLGEADNDIPEDDVRPLVELGSGEAS